MAVLLITGAGGPAGSSLGRQLAGSEHTVIAVDMTIPTIAITGMFDVFVAVPPADSPIFLPALRELIAEHDVDLVIPTVQEELPVLAGSASLLGCDVVIGRAAGVFQAQDKLLTMWALETAGVAVPQFATLESVAAEPTAWRGGFPLVIKPRASRGGRGVQVVDDGTQWDAVAATGPGQIVQEFADGAEYAVQVYAPPSGRRPTAIVLEKTALKEGRVGNAVSVRRVDAGPNTAGADVADAAIGAASALGLVGPVDVDVRRRSDGVPVVLEVNARFGANSAYAPELLDAVLADFTGNAACRGAA